MISGWSPSDSSLERNRRTFAWKVEGRVAFGAFDEIKSAHVMIALFGIGVFVGDEFGEQRRRFGGAGAPDDFAASARVPFVANLSEPCAEEFVFLFVGGDAEGFEVPTIFAVVLLGERGPDFRRIRRFIVTQRDCAFAADLW